jgi:hypothetical protein
VKGYEFVVHVEGDEGFFTFEIKITYFYHQPAMGKWCDSADDAYGYTELEFEVQAGFYYDEDGNEITMELEAARDMAETFDEEITEDIMRQITEFEESY